MQQKQHQADNEHDHRKSMVHDRRRACTGRFQYLHKQNGDRQEQERVAFGQDPLNLAANHGHSKEFLTQDRNQRRGILAEHGRPMSHRGRIASGSQRNQAIDTDWHDKERECAQNDPHWTSPFSWTLTLLVASPLQ